MPEIKTLDHLVKQLQDASPLQGKTIFFDEFQALDNIEPVEEQNKVIEFLKLVFATEEDNKAIVVNEKIKSSYRLDLKGVIIAVATNINLPDLKCMEGGKVGEALMSRIFNISIPLLMKTDLKEDIDEFVKKFLIHKFYKFAITRHFEDNVSITDKAKEQIVEDLKNETQHLPKVTGRDLTMKMILTINHAITEYEQENNRMLERDNSGKVVQELTIDVDNENCYKVLLNENIVDNLQFR